jgi:hypothetical protein
VQLGREAGSVVFRVGTNPAWYGLFDGDGNRIETRLYACGEIVDTHIKNVPVGGSF